MEYKFASSINKWAFIKSGRWDICWIWFGNFFVCLVCRYVCTEKHLCICVNENCVWLKINWVEYFFWNFFLQKFVAILSVSQSIQNVRWLWCVSKTEKVCFKVKSIKWHTIVCHQNQIGSKCKQGKRKRRKYYWYKYWVGFSAFNTVPDLFNELK